MVKQIKIYMLSVVLLLTTHYLPLTHHYSHLTPTFAEELDIVLKNVYPKIVTPFSSSGQNDKVFFEFEILQGAYEYKGPLKIFNVCGYKVTELSELQHNWLSNSYTKFRLIWDVKTESNKISLLPGVYIYQFEIPKGKVYTGTIIVAR